MDLKHGTYQPRRIGAAMLLRERNLISEGRQKIAINFLIKNPIGPAWTASNKLRDLAWQKPLAIGCTERRIAPPDGYWYQQ